MGQDFLIPAMRLLNHVVTSPTFSKKRILFALYVGRGIRKKIIGRKTVVTKYTGLKQDSQLLKHVRL